MASPLIVARDVKKSYLLETVETQVLKGVDLEVPAQGLLAILGASGAGKSTLLHILSSLDFPSSGEVLFDGRVFPERDEDLSILRNERIGFVFQFHHLMPEFTALENVMMPLLIRGESRRSSADKARDILQRLGLEGRGHHRPAEMSGGEQQRVAVARAAVASPQVLFADEPTGNLDHENGERLADLLFDLHQERKMTVVLVTHNEGLAARFPARVHLVDGRIQ